MAEMARSLLLAFVVAAAGSTACATSETIFVVRQEAPNPFTGRPRKFIVQDVGDRRVFVGKGHTPEAQWLPLQDSLGQRLHAVGRAELLRCLNDELRVKTSDIDVILPPDTSPGSFVVSPQLEWMMVETENGQTDAKARLSLQVRTADGRLLDDVAFERERVEASTERRVAVEQAFCGLGKGLAESLRDYLAKRSK